MIVVGASQGWQCPLCQKIYSPWQYECTHCNNIKPETTTAAIDWPEKQKKKKSKSKSKRKGKS